jgi:glycosyltransferase involved in cell wall biosynthesis
MRVVAVGSIQARKGTDLFCEAAIKVCKRVTHVDFYWIGRPLNFEPGFYEACLQRVRESGFVDRIKFCGFVERSDVYLAQCDLFVLPSRDEPLGLAALEAMAFGKLVIMFDVGGLAELMGGYGVVLGEPSAESLADKIVELSTGSRDHLIREDARHRVLDYFSPRQYALRLASALESGLAS